MQLEMSTEILPISRVLFEATVKVEATADMPDYRKHLDQRPLPLGFTENPYPCYDENAF